MRKTIIVFLSIMLIAKLSFGQDLLDEASEIFNVDIMSIDKVLKLGSSKKGIVIAMWLKNGNVMTKTLKKTKQKESYAGDSVRQWNETVDGWQARNPLVQSEYDRGNYPDSLTEERINEDISRLEEVINKSEWTQRPGAAYFKEEAESLSALIHFADFEGDEQTKENIKDVFQRYLIKAAEMGSNDLIYESRKYKMIDPENYDNMMERIKTINPDVKIN